MPVPQPIHLGARRLLRDDVFDMLRDAIVSGQFLPGERLKDDELVAWTGASRTPIRDAVNKLQTLGLVEVLPQKHTQVARINPVAFAQGIEVLSALYVHLVRETVPLLTDADFTQLREHGGDAASGRPSTAFWSIFTRRYGNTVVDRIHSNLEPGIQRVLNIVAPLLTQTAGSSILREIVDASVERDAETAAGKAAEYYTTTVPSLLAVVDAEFGGSSAPQEDGVLGSGAAKVERASRRLLSDEIYDLIEAAILDGTLTPGEELRDEELIGWLGTSRTPIRTALAQLADIGLIETLPNRYTRVAPLDFGLVTQTIDAMAIFYEHLARTQTPVEKGAVRVELRATADEIRLGADGRDITKLTTVINGFFLVLARDKGNKVLIDQMDSMVPTLRRSLTPRPELIDLAVIGEFMGRVHEAIEAGEAQRAGDQVHDLFEPTRANFLDNIRPADAVIDGRVRSAS